MPIRRTFLIVEAQTLVQVDLSQAILELCPDAHILTASTTEHAHPLLDDVDRLTGAIVGIGVPRLKESGLAQRIEALGAWTICLNGRHADYIIAEGWHPLARPFSSDDAQRLVGSLLDQNRMAPAAD